MNEYKMMAKNLLVEEQLLIEQTVKFKDRDGKDHEIDMETAKQYAADVKDGDTSDYKKAMESFFKGTKTKFEGS